ncbi:NADH-quinone oxidoreductase subunit L [Nocardioides aquaticus]|uniref:NADH-quinone oxidoreductase subunit L n=1 Tax=Nocardioides aquaticus TaxID=160826 RepID=A0ABX8EFR4_9ACTN|nr:proton-conducting transporter membrane subunit [Nocardioides aquaticus]QVT79356.1 NADH-quinone oxidoreductase subunit L [Nocardioides aquaticus]
MSDLTLVALVVLPAVVGVLLLLIGSGADRSAAPVGVGTAALLAAASFAVSFPAISRPSVATPFMAGADLGLGVDGLAALVLPAVAVVSALVLLAASGTPALRTARFYGLMLLFVAAALMTVLATTLPTLLMSWEVMGATSFALVGYHWRDQETISSGTTAFLTTRTADVGLYVAAGAALAGGAGLGLAALPNASGGWRDVIAAGLVVAGLGKAAQLPFSFWLSRAMLGPSPVSALLHSAAMVAMGGYLLLRVAPTLGATGWADDAAAWAGAATAVLLGMVALAQRDLKQLLAASTAAQLGFVVLAAGVGATAGGATHLVAHAAVKAGLFLAAGIWLEALGTKRLSSLTGAARLWPVVGACAAAALLSLAGLPPLALWATKDAVLAAAAEQSPTLYVAGLVGAALSAAYATKALVVLTRGLPDDAESRYDDERDGTRAVPGPAWVPLLPLAAEALLLGVLALPPVFTDVRELAGGASQEPSTLELVTSAMLAVVVIVATVAVMRGVQGRRFAWPRVLRDWLLLEPLAHRSVVRPVEVLAHRLAHLDDAVLDRGVEATAGGTVRLARTVALLDDRLIDGAVAGIVSGVRRVGGLARRPQTGQLHQYYLQALAVLALVLVVLVLVR